MHWIILLYPWNHPLHFANKVRTLCASAVRNPPRPLRAKLKLNQGFLTCPSKSLKVKLHVSPRVKGIDPCSCSRRRQRSVTAEKPPETLSSADVSENTLTQRESVWERECVCQYGEIVFQSEHFCLIIRSKRRVKDQNRRVKGAGAARNRSALRTRRNWNLIKYLSLIFNENCLFSVNMSHFQLTGLEKCLIPRYKKTKMTSECLES